MARNREYVLVYSRHVTPNIPASVVNPRVQEREERRLDQLAGAQRHESCILAGDAKLDMVKETDVLQKRASVCDDLASPRSLEPMRHD